MACLGELVLSGEMNKLLSYNWVAIALRKRGLKIWPGTNVIISLPIGTCFYYKRISVTSYSDIAHSDTTIIIPKQ